MDGKFECARGWRGAMDDYISAPARLLPESRTSVPHVVKQSIKGYDDVALVTQETAADDLNFQKESESDTTLNDDGRIDYHR